MSCRNAIFLLAGLAASHCVGQVVFDVAPLDIRPAGADFAPVLVDSSLIFTSVRDRAQAIAYTGAGTDTPLADLYRVQLRGGKPGRPRLMGGVLCSKFNDGPATLSPGGDTICFTRNSGAKRRSSDRLSLFFSVMKGGEWSPPVPFAHNGADFSTMAASFSADGQHLYFTSDRPGGFGGMDLWACRREGANWAAPKNLGPVVNSPANEAYPSTGPHGELYFSSDRPGGLGKLDVYSCVPEYGEFSIPMALPAPVNSPGNDLGYTLTGEGLSGYFSSDREGRDRIYRFRQRPELFINCSPQKANSYCFHFEDVGSTNTDTLPLRYEWDLGDGSKVAATTTDHCFVKPGTYTVKLNLIDTVTESVYFNQVSYELEVADEEQAYINTLDSAGTGQAVAFDTKHSNLPGFTPETIHWDLGDSSHATGGSIAHSYAQAGTYTVRMDMVGGPDGRGGFAHHCSTRTLKVIDGITVEPGEQPEYANAAPGASGYGFNYEELPADAFNMAASTAEDVPFTVQLFASKERVSLSDARFLPISPHYSVIERFLPSDRLYTYSIGSGKTPLAMYRAFALAKQSGFVESKVLRMPKEVTSTMAELEQLPLDKLNNTLVRVSMVRFKSGERVFDASFDAVLEKLRKVLVRYPKAELMIEAHTDAVGSSGSNLALSLNRAQAVLEYFTARGITASRLRPIGFGEDRPIATNATRAGRALNRRVEFRFIVPRSSTTAHP